MVILGIDPGSITTGYAFLQVSGNEFSVLQYGVLHAGANDALENRLLKIVTGLEELLDKFHPQALAMEGVFFAKNAKSALVLGHIRGAILVACRRRGMTFDEYPPRLVKQAVTGDGAASKEQVANMVFARLGIEPGDLLSHGAQKGRVDLLIEEFPYIENASIHQHSFSQYLVF